LFDLIRQRVSAGAVLRDGVRIPFGWTILTVRGNRGDLVLWEPDFDADPATGLRENLDFSLAGYRRQQDLIAAVGLGHWHPPVYGDNVFVEHGALGDERILARRMSDQQGENGWFVFRIHAGGSMPPSDAATLDDQFGQVPVWHLALIRPALFDILALPVGYTARVAGGVVEVVQSPDGEVWTTG
jgi:hypothetical protein